MNAIFFMDKPTSQAKEGSRDRILQLQLHFNTDTLTGKHFTRKQTRSWSEYKKNNNNNKDSLAFLKELR